MKILVVDDELDVKVLFEQHFRKEIRNGELTLIFASNGFDALDVLDNNKQSIPLVLSDINMPGMTGIDLLKKIRILHTDPPPGVIMITAYGDIDLAVRSLKEGASDFVIKPWHNERLLETIREALQRKSGTGQSNVSPGNSIIGTELLGESEPMQDIFKKIEKVAPTDANILILGENGTGKDLVAQAIHQRSLRAKGPFVKTDVGSLTETLFESELFGYRKGAFTDAKEDRTGRIESANGGTLFLDEIGNISLHQQAKLLTVLQNRQVTRLGTNQSVPVDIRLICATNVPFAELANETRFRKDLIYRINTVEITIPPLRKRIKDIPLLAKHFMKQYAAKYFKPELQLDSSALNKLSQYHFPGNVRELQYTIERAVIMCENEMIGDEDLIFSPLETLPDTGNENADMRLSTVERNAIMRVIEKHNGNITRAAKELGLTRTALYRRLSKYDI